MSIIPHHDLEYLAHKYGSFAIAGLLVMSLLAPLFIRMWIGSPITPGAESYAQLLDAQSFLDGGSIPTVYAALLGVMVVFGVPWLLPMLLAGIFVILLGFFLSYHLKSKSVIMITIAAIVISPTLSFAGTWHSPVLLAGIFFLSALLCMRKHYVFVIGFIIATTLTIPAFGLMLVFTLALLDSGWHKRAAYAVTLIAAITMCVFISHPLLGELFLKDIDSSILFELGAVGGISVFYIILAIYGLMMGVYGSRPKMIAAFIALSLSAIIFPTTMLLLVCITSLLLGYAMMQILMTDWKLEMLQETLVIIIGCIVMFLLITSGRQRINESPDGDIAHALIYLHNTQREGSVLTAPQYAPLVIYFSGRQPVLSSKSNADLLMSRDARQSYSEFDRNKLAYVLMTDEMRGTILPRSDSGIMFFLDHSERFIKIAESKTTRTWYYIPAAPALNRQ